MKVKKLLTGALTASLALTSLAGFHTAVSAAENETKRIRCNLSYLRRNKRERQNYHWCIQ